MDKPEISYAVRLDSSRAPHLLHPVHSLDSDAVALCGKAPGAFGWRRGTVDKAAALPLCAECRVARGR